MGLDNFKLDCFRLQVEALISLGLDRPLPLRQINTGEPNSKLYFMLTAQAPVILVVDDNDNDFYLVQRQIRKKWPSSTVLHASCLAEFEQVIGSSKMHLVVCDYAMPDITPARVKERLGENKTPVPVIMMSGMVSEKEGAQAMLDGFSDYIEKDKPDRLLPAIERELNTIILREERNQFARAHEEAIHTDLETGFLSKPGLNRLVASLEGGPDNRYIVSVHIDQASKEWRTELYRRMLELAGPQQVAKLTDDLFALVLIQTPTPSESPSTINDKVLQRLAEIEARLLGPVVIGGMTHKAKLSLGVCKLSDPSKQAADMVAYAQAIGLTLRRLGLSLACGLEQQIFSATHRRLTIADQLEQAIADHSLQLAFQPVLDLKSNAVVGFEALVRWKHPDLGQVMPGEFIEICEDNGLIEPLGELVIEQACHFIQELTAEGYKLWCAVNCSTSQLLDQRLEALVREKTQAYEIEPRLLEFEITETAALEDFDKASATIASLNALGCNVAMDDFGTGYSSLSYLHKLQLQVLKIDKGFVQELLNNEASKKIVKAIIELAHALELVVQAEGIETETQKQTLADMGCDRIQGYQIAKPLDRDAVFEWLKNQTM